jgi:hypothetical protein
MTGRTFFKRNRASKKKNQSVEKNKSELEQVRKRGLPPPLLGLEERGQAPLPDLFFSTNLFYFNLLALVIGA